MLEIYTNGQLTDLGADTEITLDIENPMFTDDRIPAPYALDYELPLSVRNRRLFGFPDRLTSRAAMRDIPTTIHFGGLVIARGMQKVEQVGETLSLSFTGALFPESRRRFLFRQDLGQLYLGTVEIPESGQDFDSSQSRSYCDTVLKKLANDPNAYMVAPPVGIRDVEFPASEGSDSFNQQNHLFINFFSDGYTAEPDGSNFSNHISKILPAFRIGWLFETIFGDSLTNNIFDSGPLNRLMLLSRWHPKYQVDNDFPVMDLDKSTGNTSITYADFLPKMAANEFVVQMLKIPCATMFATGEGFSIELNKDILVRSDADIPDWTDRIVGDPEISLDPGRDYEYGYNGDDGELADEIVPVKVNSIRDMFRDAYAGDTLKTYEIASTGQIIESLYDTDSGNRFRFHVVRQAMGKNEKREEDDPLSDERSSYDAHFGGTVLWNNLRGEVLRDGQNKKRFQYVPEGPPIDDERPDDLTIGLYWGLKKRFDLTDTTHSDTYPYMSHCNYDAEGNRLGDLSLCYDGPDGLIEKYHKEFKEYMERDKRLVTAAVRLTPLDLHRLDLRRKVYVRGCIYFIKTLSVTLTSSRILPAEVELIEA